MNMKNVPEEKQRAYVEAQVINNHLKQHAEQLQKVDEKTGEILTLLEALEGIGNDKGKMLATIGGGVFLNAELKETENVFVNVGANIIVKKKIPDVKKLLVQQVQELQHYKAQIHSQAEELQEQLSILQVQLQQQKAR